MSSTEPSVKRADAAPVWALTCQLSRRIPARGAAWLAPQAVRGQARGWALTASCGTRDYAWGQDELHPLTRQGGRWFDLGLTLVDGLDTLLLMRLDAEFEDARAWVAQMRLDPNIAVRCPASKLLGRLRARC